MALPRVLVTRAPHQASALADGLRAQGIEPVLIPTIEIAPPTSFLKLDASLAQLSDFDWIVFTSTNAVEAFHSRWQEKVGKTLATEVGKTQIAAIGPATAAALELIGIKVSLVPERAVAESLAAALLPHTLRPNGEPARFFLPRAETARDVLPERLHQAGANVILAPVYRNTIPSGSAEAIRAVFADAERRPEAITFTSSSTVTNLLALLEVAGVALPPGTLRISIGPITSETLRQHDLPPHAEAGTATIPALVEKVAETLLHSRYSAQLSER